MIKGISKYVGIIWTLAILLGLSSCNKTRMVQKMNSNLADIYNPSKSSLHPDFKIHHINDSNSVVYIRIFPSELLFNQANETGDYLAFLKVSFYLFEVDNNNRFIEVSDSASISKTLNREDMRSSYFTALPLKAKIQKRYLVRVDIEDELRRSTSRNYLVVDKLNPYSEQNFRVLSKTSNYPLFTSNFAEGERFRIRYNRMGFDSIYVDYFTLDRTLPQPIFSGSPVQPMQEVPDSSWALPYNDTTSYSLGKPGIYVYKMDPETTSGLSLFNFGSSFPRVKTSDDLLAPIVYLTSSAEFRDLRLEPNRKLAVDNFWLESSGEMDDARELIRVFYNRVLFANLYFSSYKEGWKTDRGMIYIVFGPPDRLEKLPDEEKWIYLTPRSGSPMEFVFKRRNSRFTYNNFELDRRQSSTSFWAEAVSTWREGKIYSPYL